MNTTQNILTHNELASIQQLVGDTMQLIAGRSFWNPTTTMDAIIVTSATVVTIWGDSEDLAFEGFEDTYSIIHVSDGDLGGLEEAKTKGEIYLQHAGQVISGVNIVRETITEKRQGTPTWVYETDIAIVLNLENVRLCIAKSSHHDEVLKLLFAPLSSELAIPEVIGGWRPELGVEYERSTHVLPLEALLEADD